MVGSPPPVTELSDEEPALAAPALAVLGGQATPPKAKAGRAQGKSMQPEAKTGRAQAKGRPSSSATEDVIDADEEEEEKEEEEEEEEADSCRLSFFSEKEDKRQKVKGCPLAGLAVLDMPGAPLLKKPAHKRPVDSVSTRAESTPVKRRMVIMLYRNQGNDGIYGLRDLETGKQLMQVHIPGATREDNKQVAEKVSAELDKGVPLEDAKELCHQLKKVIAQNIKS